MDNFTSLGDAIDDRVDEGSHIKQKINASQVVETAQEVLQDKFGTGGIKVKSFQDNNLILVCKSSVISQEIKLKQSQIIKQINDNIGKKKVNNIKFST